MVAASQRSVSTTKAPRLSAGATWNLSTSVCHGFIPEGGGGVLLLVEAAVGAESGTETVVVVPVAVDVALVVPPVDWELSCVVGGGIDDVLEGPVFPVEDNVTDLRAT